MGLRNLPRRTGPQDRGASTMKKTLLAALALAAAASPTHGFAWGALSVSEDGESWGWSVEHPTEVAAKRNALAECGAGCTWVVSFRNSCAAYAQDGNTGAWGWSEGQTRGEAERAAIGECRSAGGGSACRIRVWGCDR